ncbi:MAG: F0F1 ATP synthase subunit B [Campylobacterota bacterium]|nr:F0F1 ATP synthase subunit B [Campylobacterota bacterium]
MKLKHIVTAAVVLLPVILLASEGSGQYEAITGRSTDFFPRVFNFLIFFGILYYLLANPIKNFFMGRKEGIAKQLKEIEEKLQDSKDERKEAEVLVGESKKKAEEIIATAGKEAEILVAKIADNSVKELKVLEKQFGEKTALEERKVIRESISDVLSNNISTDDIPLDEKKVINLIDKKVA